MYAACLLHRKADFMIFIMSLMERHTLFAKISSRDSSVGYINFDFIIYLENCHAVQKFIYALLTFEKFYCIFVSQYMISVRNSEVLMYVNKGSMVSFNLKRPDGSWFGYREVEKLASLSGIQLRVSYLKYISLVQLSIYICQQLGFRS